MKTIHLSDCTPYFNKVLVLIAFLLCQSSALAASSSSSFFGISSADPLLVERIRSTTWNNATRLEQGRSSAGQLCAKLYLTRRQKQMCLQDGDGLAQVLLNAIRLSASFCQQQFQYERWNCSLNTFYRLRTLHKAYRETAVLEAFSAAGVKHAISRGCAAGHLKKCHCAEAGNMVETRQTWKWGGCGDNLSYGHSFTTKFLGGGPMKSIRKVKKVEKRIKTQNGRHPVKLKRWKGTTSANVDVKNQLKRQRKDVKRNKTSDADVDLLLRRKITRHNNAVGLKIVERLVNRTCKCHGVSGACTMQTCWNQLAHFSEVARTIKQKYENADTIRLEIRENSSRKTTVVTKSKGSWNHLEDNLVVTTRNKSNKRKLKGRNGDNRWELSFGGKVNRSELLYQNNSPDLCKNNELGPGTVDRTCEPGDNCEILCCGRGYNVHKITVATPCKCKLVLCCKVECQTCVVQKMTHTCK